MFNPGAAWLGNLRPELLSDAGPAVAVSDLILSSRINCIGPEFFSS
jgi:hypothetical protein